ncbi:MAG: lysine--tRNA ligase [Bdellovibrionota bacterium]
MMSNNSTHWADITADRVIREKGDKEVYTVASGITPSGFVHFGNFREAITVNLVARALQDKGKKVRIIHSWDDFDTFRKVPKDIEDQEKYKSFLFQPIIDVPDPYGNSSSYARHFEELFEAELAKVGFKVDFLYQAKKYRAGEYKEDIIHTLKHAEQIRKILDEYRTTPLDKDWLPVSIYCPVKLTDQIAELTWDGNHILNYVHETGHKGSLDLNDPKDLAFVKLPWRIDWPMRWAKEAVDFEPAGKDHSSDGGSYDTAKEIVKAVYNTEPPVYLQYDFVGIKGGAGKISSSEGNVITLTDVLKLYEPEIIRWIFASYKPNVDFSVGFDEDVIKLYENFDRQERLAFGLEAGNEKKVAAAKRAYELAQLEAGMPDVCPIQPSFRHLTTNLQIFDGDLDKTRELYLADIKNERDERRFNQRAQSALNWLELYAPEDFTFKINSEKSVPEMSDAQTAFMRDLRETLARDWDGFNSDKDLHDKIYERIHANQLEPTETFPIIYQHLISRDKGPRLASFIRTLGKDRVLAIL